MAAPRTRREIGLPPAAGARLPIAAFCLNDLTRARTRARKGMPNLTARPFQGAKRFAQAC